MKETYFIVGLGMMGSSYASKLSKEGFIVYGFDKDESTSKKALELGYIKNASINALKEADVVVLTLYPNDNILFVEKHLNDLKHKKLVTDISGVKENIVDKISQLLPNNYISHHPMAGSEKSGIDACNPNIFINANFLIIKDKSDNIEALNLLKVLAKRLEFNEPKLVSRETHDQMISFVSQLPHMIASSLVNSDIYENSHTFTGDSYKDLTRIAYINEDLWLELFKSNKDNLIKDMKRFNIEFNKLLNALENSDSEELKELLKKGKEKRRRYY